MPKFRMIKKFTAFILAVITLYSTSALLTYDTSAVTPTYYVSSAYKKSQFYKNLTSYKLTGDERYDVLSIALTQYGYHEGNDDSDMGGSNRDGYKNFAEYNRMYGKLDNGEGNGLSYGYSWCAAFVSWCLRQARVPTETVETFVSCSRAVRNFRAKGIFKERNSGYVPLPGDIIFFIKPEDAAEGYVSSHVGFVIGTDGEFVYTIEGNTDLYKVCQKKYPLDGEKIVGYAVPEYNTLEGTVYDFPLRDDGKYPGMFEITKSGIEVHREIYGTDDVIGTLSEGDRVKVLLTDLGWGMIEFEGAAGWIPLEYAESRNYEVRLEAVGAEPESRVVLKPRGEFVPLAQYIPQKEGFTLAGWAKEEGGEIAFPSDAVYSYEEDTVLYAIWKTSEYTISFVDWDGSSISSAIYAHGADVSLPAVPVREADSEFSYEFSGWDAEVTPALADVVYTATYTATPIPVTTPEETTAPETTEEETTEETFEETFEETTEELTEITAEITTKPEPVTTIPETTLEATAPVLEKGCFSFISFSVLAVVLAAIVALRKKEE